MADAYRRLIDKLHEHGCIVQERGDRTAIAQAPGHSPVDRSLSIKGIEGTVLLNSHADPKETVLDALGLGISDLFDDQKGLTFRYDGGRVVHRDPAKKFRQSGNTQDRSLFRASRLADAETIWVVEGEKDVLALESLDAVATCNAMGANKWHLFDLSPLHGKRLMVVPDQDEVGFAHVEQLKEILGDQADITVLQPKFGKDPADHIAEGYALDDFTVVRPPMPDGPITLREATDLWLDWMETPPEARRPIPSPWNRFNEVTAGGFYPRRTYIIGGRPGAGKTLAALNIAQKAGEESCPVLVFSLEMSMHEMTGRLIANGAGANYGQITRGELDDRNQHLVELYLTPGMRVDDTKLWLSDDSIMTVEAIRSMSKRVKQHDPTLGLIVVDHVGLVRPTEFRVSRQQQLHHISWQLSLMAKELEVAVVITAQLNRGSETTGAPPKKSDLRESGDLEQNADVICLLHHEKLGDAASGDVTFLIDKNRTGPSPSEWTEYWRPNMARIGGTF